MLCTTTCVEMAMLQCIAVSSWTRKNSNFFCAFKSLYLYFMAMRRKHRHIVKWKILLLECVFTPNVFSYFDFEGSSSRVPTMQNVSFHPHQMMFVHRWASLWVWVVAIFVWEVRILIFFWCGFYVHQTTIPVRDVVTVLRMNGYDVMESYDAGRFVCNYVYYQSLRHSAAYGNRSIFVHVPLFIMIDEEHQLQFVAALLHALAFRLL